MGRKNTEWFGCCILNKFYSSIKASLTFFTHTHTHKSFFIFWYDWDNLWLWYHVYRVHTHALVPSMAPFFSFFFFIFFLDTYLIYIFKLVKFLFLVKLRQDRSLIFITNFVLIKPLWRERQAHSRRFWYPRMYLFFLYSLLHYGWWVVTCQ